MTPSRSPASTAPSTGAVPATPGAAGRAAPDGSLVHLLGDARSRILDELRTAPRSNSELAGLLGVSDEAVRRHLRSLEHDGFIASELQRGGGRGRPRSLYRLSDEGRRLYPDRTGELANELWEYLEAEYGRRAILGFVRWRRDRQRRRYQGVLHGGAGADPERDHGADDPGPHDPDLHDAGTSTDELPARGARLAELLSADGYLAHSAEVDGSGGRRLQLTQTHCAVADVASEHPEICAHEAAMFADLLGARVTRRSTIAAGDLHCVCTVDAADPGERTPHGTRPDDGPSHPAAPQSRTSTPATGPQPQENRHGDAR